MSDPKDSSVAKALRNSGTRLRSVFHLIAGGIAIAALVNVIVASTLGALSDHPLGRILVPLLCSLGLSVVVGVLLVRELRGTVIRDTIPTAVVVDSSRDSAVLPLFLRLSRDFEIRPTPFPIAIEGLSPKVCDASNVPDFDRGLVSILCTVVRARFI